MKIIKKIIHSFKLNKENVPDMKTRKTIMTLAILLAAYVLLPYHAPAISADKISFAVIFLGGPDTGEEGEKIITQFVNSLSKLSGMSKNSIQGKYFNNIADAKTYIQQNKNSYVMASLGFYLANRKGMNLLPLALVKIQGNDKEQYYLIVKKGKYESLKELKGKILAGNIIYEDKKFINKLVFNNKVDISTYFKLKPSNRPRSAIRKLTSGEYDAVLLNHMQYNNLKRLPEFSGIQIIHESAQMPALGFMMVNTSKNKSSQKKIINAITRMCNQDDTREACKNFGIDGFDKIEPEILDNEIKKYEKGDK